MFLRIIVPVLFVLLGTLRVFLLSRSANHTCATSGRPVMLRRWRSFINKTVDADNSPLYARAAGDHQRNVIVERQAAAQPLWSALWIDLGTLQASCG